MASRKSAPTWRGPAAVLDIDEKGVAADFRAKTSRVARYCARKRADSKNAGEAELVPVSDRSDEPEVWLSAVSSMMRGGDAAQPAKEDGASDVSPPSLSIQVPPHLPWSAQVPPSPSFSAQAPTQGSSLDENCAGQQGPECIRGAYDQFTYDSLHQSCRRRGYAR